MSCPPSSETENPPNSERAAHMVHFASASAVHGDHAAGVQCWSPGANGHVCRKSPAVWFVEFFPCAATSLAQSVQGRHSSPPGADEYLPAGHARHDA